AGFEIRVRDSGMGIPPEEQERIFDRFHQGDTAIKSQPGTGIGLSLARELVELHKGSIVVESQVGQGTTFLVRLPAGREHLRPEDMADGEVVGPHGAPASTSMHDPFDADDPVDHAADESATADRMSVLIVEDHPQVRALVRKHLEPRYRILEAEDGRKGLAMALREIPDLIVSDVMMPGMDGMELTKAVKDSAEIGFVPVLLLTARADLEDRLTAYSRGADAYLAKPFEPRELVARIDGLIQERRRLKERYAALAPGLHLAGMTSSDEAYLTSVSQVIMKNLADEDFSVEALARQLGQTRTTLFRRIKEAGHTTPSAMIRRLRLEQGRLMLEKGVGSVNEVAYGVGFKSVSHFCTAFRLAYGSAPGAWKAKGADPLDKPDRTRGTIDL
ncbi:MAG TPA: response regulator, partial [Candidatus Eisenbacteria bacterium]